MMCAAQAALGSPGISRVQVWVDCTCSLLGSQAMIGVDVGTLFVVGASLVRKWLVAPESRIAHSLIVAALVLMVWSRVAAA